MKSYKNSIPSYASVLSSPDTPAGDLDMVYGFAKIMDPDSAVREGEAKSVQDLGTIGQSIVGSFRKQFDSSGRLPPDLRAQMRQTLANRVTMLNEGYTAERARYRELAIKQGIDPDLVVGPHLGDAYARIENQYFRRDPNKGPRPAGEVGPGDRSLATGNTRNEPDPASNAIVNAMVRSGASDDQIDAALKVAGGGSVDRGRTAAWRSWLNDPKHPEHRNYEGGMAAMTKPVPQSLLNRVSSSGLGVAAGGYVDGLTAGFSDEAIGAINALKNGQTLREAVREANAKKQDAFGLHPGWAFAGNAIGNMTGAYAGGALLKGGALATSLTSKLGERGAIAAGDLAYGALSGAGESNDNRLFGGVVGGALGVVGRPLGEVAAIPAGAFLRTAPVVAATNKARGLFGRGLIQPVPALSPAQQAAAGAISKAGPGDVRALLSEARDLDLPMTLADTHAEPRELMGAAVRRSPTASQVAEGVLIRRSRSQFDRYSAAINRDLGPTTNVPELSERLAQKGADDAGPLYQKAYPVQVDDPQLNELLAHPELKDAWSHAQALHANDVALAKAAGREPPAPLKKVWKMITPMPKTGDEKLDNLLEPVKWPMEDAFANRPHFDTYEPPNIQAIDYIARGLQAKIDAAYAGGSLAKMNLPFLKGAKKLLLERADTYVPEFKAARQAYGGPMQSREALEFGRGAVTSDPKQLGVTIAGQSPEQLAQSRLGLRSGLVDAGGKIGYGSNPYALLDSPAAEQRIGTMFSGDASADPSRLLRQRDLERGMQNTSNAIIANSKTAQRQIADQAFAGDDALSQIADVGVNLATGQVPTGVVLKGLASQHLKDWLNFGVGKRAVAKADELAPMLLNPDPAVNVTRINDLLRADALRRAYIERMRPTRTFGMIGRGLGAATTPRITGY